MAENSHKISQIQVGDTTYDICDAIARNAISSDNLKIILIKNKNSMSVTAGSTLTWTVSLDNLGIDDSTAWRMAAVLGIHNEHNFAFGITNWWVNNSKKTVSLIFRNWTGSAATINAKAIEISILLVKNTYWSHLLSQDNGDNYYEV